MKKIIKTILMAVACGGLFPAAATAQSYQLVKNENGLESGKRYLIVAESSSTCYAWSGFNEINANVSGNGSATEISASENTINDTGEATPLLLVKSDNMWKIIDLKTEKYLGVPGSNINQLSESSAFNSDRFLWNISFDNSGKPKVYQIHSGNGQYLKFISTTMGRLFNIYDQSGGTDISLYKETGEAGNTLILHNSSDNSTAISEAANKKKDVILENRILHKDGKWNTLCLPFDYSTTGPLAGATIMELDTKGKYKYDNEKWEIDATNGTQKTGFNAADGTLCLFFKTAESIEAGKPYIIKWEGASGVIDSPIFSNVTVSSATSDVTSSDGYVTFNGGYDVQKLTAGDTSILFLGSSDKLYYPEDAMNINAFRAYFQLNNGLTAGDPSLGRSQILAFALNLSDSNENTGVSSAIITDGDSPKGWYTLDGRKLDGKPMKHGLYINNGKKVAIK